MHDLLCLLPIIFCCWLWYCVLDGVTYTKGKVHNDEYEFYFTKCLNKLVMFWIYKFEYVHVVSIFYFIFILIKIFFLMQTHLLHLYGIDFVNFLLYPCCTYSEKYYLEWCLSSVPYVCGWPNVWCQILISGTSSFSRVRWMMSSWVQDPLDTFITCQIKIINIWSNVLMLW